MKKTITFLAAAAVVFSFESGKAKAQSGIGLSVDAAYAERYIWRGIPINEEAVLQPSVTISDGNFSINGWGNMDMTDWGDSKNQGYGDESGNFSEVDYTAGFEKAWGPVSVGLGFITYTFPNHSEWGPGLSTTEVYFGLGFDLPLSPSIYTYVDIDNQGKTGTEGANYTSLDLGHSFELMESVGLDLSGHLGYGNHKFMKVYYGINEKSDFHDWSASVGLPISLPMDFSLTPAYVYSSLMNKDCRDVVDAAGLDEEAGIFMVSLGWSGEL